uniref:Uncharacterized protein n=1 Tax=Trichobilharzia regenti TaxID=157069 RepID=A0AA85KIB7_TRIRE|nr:unnamed protein product [Trichobilharzia regenti]
MSPSGLLSECPIHLHFLLHICWLAIGSCFVCSHNSLLVILSGHLIFSIERRQLLIKVCSLLEIFFVTRQVSDPYRRTDFTFVLKIRRILLLMLSDEDFQIDFRLMNVFLAFPILDLTSSSAPPVVETMLPR